MLLTFKTAAKVLLFWGWSFLMPGTSVGRMVECLFSNKGVVGSNSVQSFNTPAENF